MTSGPELEELVRKLESGEITLEDIPPDAMQYALSSLPDLDQNFFNAYREKFGLQDYRCPFCSSDNWSVVPFFGAFMSLRSYGTQGVHSNKEVYAIVECTTCRYSMMFNVREHLEQFAKEAEDLNVQMQGMRDQHGTEPTDAEKDPPQGDNGPPHGEAP
jgi:transcription elongation factor Elf1